jgi:hypothetical protein
VFLPAKIKTRELITFIGACPSKCEDVTRVCDRYHALSRHQQRAIERDGIDYLIAAVMADPARIVGAAFETI